MPTKTPTIIAHRGLHETLPENSKEAMVAAWKSGIAWCECDVHLSADGVAVVMHDDKLDRTTEDKGPVAQRTWAELHNLRLKKRNKSLSECHIASLEEVLAGMPAGCGLVIEIKPEDNERLVREVVRLCKGRRVVIQSFDEANVRYAIRLGQGAATALLVDKPERLDAAMTGDWPAVNISFKLIDGGLAKRAQDAGKSLGAWTVNAPADIRHMLEIGVDRIITDSPKQARDAGR